MTFSVIWKLTAIQQLNRITASAVDPQRIRDAASRIDAALRRTPRDMGESRSPGHRVWYEDVLSVLYKIDEAAMRVEVLLVGPARRR
jgi:hypothetical protein